MDVKFDQGVELNKDAAGLPENSANLAVLEEMMKAGLFIGRKSSKTHPRAKPFIFGIRNKSAVIDLEETLKSLERAMEFVKEKISANKGVILLIGTTPSAKKSVKETASKLGLLFVIERWLGGMLTNFKTISKRISHFKKLKSDRDAGRLDKYTKKERLEFDRQIAKLNTFFSGLEKMEALPDILFIADVNSHLTAVREAKRLKIPVIGILNTDTDPALVDYPILANDHSKTSIDWILARLEKAVEESRANPRPAPISQ